MMCNAGKDLIGNTRRRHLEAVVLEEGHRRVSQDCSRTKNLYDALPKCRTNTNVLLYHDTELPTNFGEIFCAVGRDTR